MFNKSKQSELCQRQVDEYIKQQRKEAKALVLLMTDNVEGQIDADSFVVIMRFITHTMKIDVRLTLAAAGYFDAKGSYAELVAAAEEVEYVWEKDTFTDAQRSQILELICQYL